MSSLAFPEDRSAARRQAKYAARRLAAEQGGVLIRSQLADLGVTEAMLRAELDAGRWERLGRSCVTVHGIAVAPQGYWRAALAHSCAAAALDGVTALQAAGLRGFTDRVVHVSVPRGSRGSRLSFVRVHELRALDEDHIVKSGLRRVRPAVAAARAAVWLPSARAAATLMAMSVQQRVVDSGLLVTAVRELPGNARRSLASQLADDIHRGAHSLAELDFAACCRRYGLPQPDRQVVRRRPGGNAYLDVHWENYRLTVEIDGSQHFLAEKHDADLLRHNDLALGGDMVLRISVLGLRILETDYLRQVAAGLRAGGWQG